MATIYISHSHQDKELAKILTDELIRHGHNVFLDSESLQAGINWREKITDSLKQSDVVLALLTENSIKSEYVLSEIGAARAYASSSSNEKLFIPIVFGDIQLPLTVRDIQAVFIENIDSISGAVTKVRGAIDSLLGRKIASEQKREERIQKIERTSANYIDEAIEELKKRESNLETKANTWNYIGWGALVVGVISAIILVIITLTTTDGAVKNWPEFSYLALKSVIIVALLIASAKYAFSLANSYMTESLKNSDRIHAISFGKFFLQAFGDNIDTKEVKEIFQHWNISNKSSFSELNADKFDPKVIEAVLSVADAVKGKSSSKKKP